MPSRKQTIRSVPQELTARILSRKRNYLIGHMGARNDSFVDDEAALEIEATIERARASPGLGYDGM